MSDTDAATAALRDAAQALHDSARTHKRAEFQHRKQARTLARSLDVLRDECERFGITLHIDTDPH